MHKFLYNVLIGLGSFFVSYPIANTVNKGAEFGNEAFIFISVGIVLLIIGFWGYNKSKRKDKTENGF